MLDDTPLKSTRGLLVLRAIRGVGEVSSQALLEAFTTFEEMLRAAPETFKGVVNSRVVAAVTDRNVLEQAAIEAGRTVERAARDGVRVISRFDDEWPRRLNDCDPEISVLYIAGNLATCERSVACVGTRHPTKYGEMVTARLAGVLAGSGWAIVSGLADGVDWISHMAAIEAGTPTIAVLGSGLDTWRSDAAMAMAERIIAAGGCVVTEQPYGRAQDAGTLIRRNRIQAALSVAVFPMQMGLESGTMHTVRYALTEGRRLFAPVPPEKFAEEAENEGVFAILGSAEEFTRKVTMKDQLRDKVLSDFGAAPVATAIPGRDHYPQMLAALEEALGRMEPARTPAPTL